MTSRTLTHADPRDLRKHLFSLQIYGEQSDDGFDESISRRGVDEPIVLAADAKTIISGVRRRNGAIKAGQTEVPCLVRQDLVDDLDIREAILEANRHNEQSVETKARVYEAYKEIETERAKRRQGTRTDIRANLPTSSTGRAAEKASANVGMSRRTAEKAAEVVEVIDKAEAEGDEERASELRETLNNKSVSAAHQQATEAADSSKTLGTRHLADWQSKQARAVKTAEALLRAVDDLNASQPNGALHPPTLGLAKIQIELLNRWRPPPIAEETLCLALSALSAVAEIVREGGNDRNDEPDTPIIDELGELIPDQLRTVFERGTQARRLTHDIERLRRQIDECGFGMSTTGLAGEAEALRDHLPYVVCPECRGDACEGCHKRGWLTETGLSVLNRNKRGAL